MIRNEFIQTYQIKYYQAKTIQFEAVADQIEKPDVALDNMNNDNQSQRFRNSPSFFYPMQEKNIL